MRRHPVSFLSLALLLCVAFAPSALGDDRVRRGGGIVILPHAIRLADCGEKLRETHQVPADGSPLVARVPSELRGAIVVASVTSTSTPVWVSASLSGDLLTVSNADLVRLEAAGVRELRLMVVGASGDAIDMRVGLAGRPDRNAYRVEVW